MNAKADERRKEDPRVRQLMEDMRAVKGDVGAMKIDMGKLSMEVANNTLLTQEVRENTAGVVQFLEDSAQAFTLFNKTMNGVRWFITKAVLPLAILVGGAYAILHEGKPPEWVKSWIDLFK